MEALSQSLAGMASELDEAGSLGAAFRLPAGRPGRARQPAFGRCGSGWTATLEARVDMLEVPMTLVINLIMYAGIALIPLALAVLFIRLGRRFSSS
jgi:hypothetical protein